MLFFSIIPEKMSFLPLDLPNNINDPKVIYTKGHNLTVIMEVTDTTFKLVIQERVSENKYRFKSGLFIGENIPEKYTLLGKYSYVKERMYTSFQVESEKARQLKYLEDIKSGYSPNRKFKSEILGESITSVSYLSKQSLDEDTIFFFNCICEYIFGLSWEYILNFNSFS